MEIGIRQRDRMRAWDLTGIAWELHEGSWLRGEPIDSLEDVMLAILSASTFLCLDIFRVRICRA
jgi:hypothetical protein